nr:4'-phosphopantetheinyl transferase superfamily protein [Alsobacter ponti]
MFAVAARRADLGATEDVLSREERRRAAAISHPGSRARFVDGRILLRRVLGRVLNRPAADLALDVPPSGKPRLAGGDDVDLRFSISVGETRVLAAVGTGVEVGADIEETAPPDFEAVALTILGDAEIREFRALPLAERTAAFLRAWTRKEALLKAAGVGFAVDPRRLAVGLSGTRGFVASDALGGRYAWADLDGLPASVAAAGEGLETRLFAL